MDKNLFTRRSIRKYTDQPVPKAMIEDILKAAMVAPTAVNDKQWLFYVVENSELKNSLQTLHLIQNLQPKHQSSLFLDTMKPKEMLPNSARSIWP